jgi:DNA repair exonuclease SbcCD ATPase subunit
VEDMNTQLAEQQTEQALPLEQAIEQLIASYHADNENVQQLSQSATNVSEENSFLKLQVKTLTGRIDTVINENEQLLAARKRDEAKEKDFNKKAEMVRANAEKHMQQLDQALRQEQQAQNSLNDANDLLARYKEIGTPKQIREQRKGYQETIKKHQAAETQFKLEIKNYRHDLANKDKEIAAKNRQIDELDYTKVYSKNGDNLAVYPLLCETGLGESAVKQVPVWYMTDEGIGALYMLNEDGEPARAPTPKTGIKPKKETMELIGTLLRKFQRNGNVVHAEDIKLLECK